MEVLLQTSDSHFTTHFFNKQNSKWPPQVERLKLNATSFLCEVAKKYKVLDHFQFLTSVWRHTKNCIRAATLCFEVKPWHLLFGEILSALREGKGTSWSSVNGYKSSVAIFHKGRINISWCPAAFAVNYLWNDNSTKAFSINIILVKNVN